MIMYKCNCFKFFPALFFGFKVLNTSYKTLVILFDPVYDVDSCFMITSQ